MAESDQKLRIWQQDSWPNFTWNSQVLAPLLREGNQLQGILLGKAGAMPEHSSTESNLDALLQNIIQSSAIEGEIINTESIRSSLAKRLGVKEAGLTPGAALSVALLPVP